MVLYRKVNDVTIAIPATVGKGNLKTPPSAALSIAVIDGLFAQYCERRDLLPAGLKMMGHGVLAIVSKLDPASHRQTEHDLRRLFCTEVTLVLAD
jgi:hypothetical protein